MSVYRQQVGRYGEDLAVGYLEKHGYTIIERNHKSSYYELDIIAWKNIETIFIEVKTRTSRVYGSADEGMTRSKITNLKKAVRAYSYRHKIDLNQVRVDLIAVDLDKIKKLAKIKHYKEII